jgi:acyl-CoA thioester hydrolase
MMRILETAVNPAWVDYNGHMGDFAYGIVFSDAATAYMDRIGIDANHRGSEFKTLYTLDSRIGYLKECHAGEALGVELHVLDADAKRMHLFMRLVNAAGDIAALCEQLLIYVSRQAASPRATLFPDEIRQQLSADKQTTKLSERPAWLDGRIGLRHE